MKTALQEIFSDLEKLHPNLFNVYTTEGKEFINHFHKYLAVEKEQIYKALIQGNKDCNAFTTTNKCEEYYNENYKNTEQ